MVDGDMIMRRIGQQERVLRGSGFIGATSLGCVDICTYSMAAMMVGYW